MVKVGAFESLITLAGVVLVGFTLYHTKRAADAAAESVNQAKAALNQAKEDTKVSREIGEAQTRAYVTIDWAEFSLEPKEYLATHAFPELKISASNSGNSPAKAFRWNVRGLYTYYQGCTCQIIRNKERYPENWGINLPSRATVEQFERCAKLPLGEKERAAMGHAVGLHIYFEVEVVYRDVFNLEITETSVFGGRIESLEQDVRRLKRMPDPIDKIASDFLRGN